MTVLNKDASHVLMMLVIMGININSGSIIKLSGSHSP